MMKKIAHSKGELVAEIISAVFAVAVIAVVIVFAVGGKGGSIIFALVTLLCYGAFSICSFMPQWENSAMYNPEKATEEKLHKIRKGCIAAKIVITGALLILSFI